MANIDLFVPKVVLFETGKQMGKSDGAYSENVGDKGGPTKFGITLATWQSCGYDKNHDGHIDKEDVKLITEDDYKYVVKRFWDSWKANNINNQSIAEILVDWVWASGTWGVKIPQRILGVKDDGSVGDKTIVALNNANQQDLFSKIYDARIKFVNDLCAAHPDQKKWLKGWINRINSFKFSN